jgi:hypothetical protein
MPKTPLIYPFKRPITVLRYVPQEIVWHKAEYRALATHLPEWDKSATLQNGCVRDGRLLLRQDLLSTVEQLPTNTLLLRGTRSADWIELFQRAHDLPFFLQLKKMEDAIWVACKDDYYPHFGSKKRDAFDILPLLAGKSVAIHINARHWHTMAGFGTDTHYVENYLYLEHLGQFDQAELVEGLAEDFHFQPQKEVDLRQMLY